LTRAACPAAIFEFAPGANSGKVDSPVRIHVHFYSYCKDLTGCASVSECVGPDARIEDLLQRLFIRFPKLAPVQKSLLVAVGVDYQGADYVLQEGDEVSLFPPVQGG
jgi:molybdopterin converting factor small subunit